MIAAIGLLVISWLFPPWTAAIDSTPARYQVGAGFHSVFRSPEVWSDNRTFRIDWRKLCLIDLGIVLAAAGTVISVRWEFE